MVIPPKPPIGRIETIALKSSSPTPATPRTHSKRQIKLIGDSLKTFGFINPILIDKDGMTIAGHGRLTAAKRLCMTRRFRLSSSSISVTMRYVPTSWRTTSSPRWRAGTTTSSRSNCSI